MLGNALDRLKQAGLFRVVLIHHPPLRVQAGWHRGLRDAGKFKKLLQQHGAELVLHGHNHEQTVLELPTATGPALIVGVPSASEAVEGRAPAEAWQRLAYVFQSPRLLPWKDALDNAAFGLEMRAPAMPAEERRARAARQLERMGLGADAHKMPPMLSGGERQRVAIARALALDPDIILMDEPFSALDPNTRGRLRQQLVELWQETGKTILFVTHDVDEALTLADRIVVLSPKPARVVRVIELAERRPRRLETDPALRDARHELLALFATLATDATEDAT